MKDNRKKYLSITFKIIDLMKKMLYNIFEAYSL